MLSNEVWTRSCGSTEQEITMGTRKGGEGSTEEGTSELDLDEWIDCVKEVLLARVKKTWNGVE